MSDSFRNSKIYQLNGFVILNMDFYPKSMYFRSKSSVLQNAKFGMKRPKYLMNTYSIYLFNV